MTYARSLKKRLKNALQRSPAVLLTGARQTGKTTLMKQLSKECGHHYVTFDNLPTLAAAQTDPVGFISALAKPAILDEVQRTPELFLPIKLDVDEHRIPGRYILTGSANPLLVPKLGDSLAGRMRVFELWPLSQGEILGSPENFLDRIFGADFGPLEIVPFSRKELVQKLLAGGFPEMQLLTQEVDRREWCDSYLLLSLQKDVQDLSRVEGLSQLPNLLVILATRIGSLLNLSDISNNVKIPGTTLRRYLQLLHSLFLLHSLPAWSNNLGKRLIKSSKIYLVDTALLLHLLNCNEERLESTPHILGSITENFVVLELIKQASWNEKRIRLYHFRTENRAEVDLVLEDERGKIVGIEVKSSETVRSDDFKHFRQLQAMAGDKFLRGIVLYAGDKQLPFGPNLFAVPISALWK